MIATVGAAALAEWLLRRALLRATRRQGVLVEFAPLLAFAAVGLALFLSFTWPEAVRRAMLILLLAVGGYRLLRSATGLLLAASSDAALDRTANLPRSIDIDQTDVPFWQNRLEWGAAIAIAGWAGSRNREGSSLECEAAGRSGSCFQLRRRIADAAELFTRYDVWRDFPSRSLRTVLRTAHAGDGHD